MVQFVFVVYAAEGMVDLLKTQFVLSGIIIIIIIIIISIFKEDSVFNIIASLHTILR